MKIPKIAVGYVRTSSRKNPKSSIPNQINIIKEYCNNNNIILKHIFEDAAKSGMYTQTRTGYLQIKELIITNQIDVLIVAYSDRLSRDTFEFILTVNDMINRNIEFISVGEGMELKRISPTQIAVLAIKAEIENTLRYKRLQSAREKDIESGKFLHPITPYGYKVDNQRFLKIEENEAKIVKRIFQQYKECKSFAKVAKGLNLDELSTRTGGLWRVDYIKLILNNRTYTGKIFGEKSKQIKGGKRVKTKETLLSNREHESIVSEKEFQIIQDLMNDKVRKKSVRNEYWFTGILHCPNCFKKMCGKLSNGRPHYICKTHNKKELSYKICNQINKDNIEKEILSFIKNNFFSEINSNNDSAEYEQIIKSKEELDYQYAIAKISNNKYEFETNKIISKLRNKQEESNLILEINNVNSYKEMIEQNQFDVLQNTLIKNGIKLTYDNKLKIKLLE